jgi:hypothetical protein
MSNFKIQQKMTIYKNTMQPSKGIVKVQQVEKSYIKNLIQELGEFEWCCTFAPLCNS